MKTGKGYRNIIEGHDRRITLLYLTGEHNLRVDILIYKTWTGMKFINREREIEMLKKLWREKEQRYIVIYRKRNIGK